MMKYQCCQVAEIPAKKLKRGQGKKIWLEEFAAETWLNFTKRGQRKFSLKIPYFTVMLTKLFPKLAKLF